MLVVTERDYMKWPSWELVFEWEDEIVKSISNTALFHAKDFCIGDKPLLGYIGGKIGFNHNTILLGKRDAFHFEMTDIAKRNKIWNQHNISACIIDFYTKDLHTFYSMHNKVKNLYVSSKEVYDFLQGNNPEREIKHLPLTISDRYRISKDKHFDKKYDLVLVGRQSPTMMEYLHTYEKTHPITYVYREKIDGNNFPYYANNGKFIGMGNTREEYFNLMRHSRTVMYSTPGIDDGKETNGFHQVTPRFLEAIASGCHVISQFIDNSDTDFYELGKMSQRVKNYTDFEKAMDYALSTPVDMQKYAKYLEKHYTSTYKNLM